MRYALSGLNVFLVSTDLWARATVARQLTGNLAPKVHTALACWCIVLASQNNWSIRVRA